MSGCTTLSLQDGCPLYAEAIFNLLNLVPNGTQAVPGLTFANFPQTGLLIDPATNGLGITVSGVERAVVTATGLNSTAIGTSTPATGNFTTLGAILALNLPNWATIARPASPSVGTAGLNTTLGNVVEYWNGTAWVQLFGASTLTAASMLAWSSNLVVANGTYIAMLSWPWNVGTINSVTYATGGSGSFTCDVEINGTGIGGLTAVSVSSSTAATTNATSGNTITKGQTVTVVISGVSGSPTTAAFQINYTHSQP